MEIIQAATKVFADEGYVGGSLRRIAVQAQLTEPGVLKHFGSKAALLLATLGHWAPLLEADLRGPRSSVGPSRETPLGWLSDRFDAHADLAAARKLFTVITAESTSTTHPARDFMCGHQTRQIDQLAGALTEVDRAPGTTALSGAQARGEALLLLALLQGLDLQWLLDPAVDVSRQLVAYLDALENRWPLLAEEASAS